MSTDAIRHHLFSIIALLSYNKVGCSNLGLAENPAQGPQHNQRMEDLEVASEFGLYNRKLHSFQSSADITLYSLIFQYFIDHIN